jgi:TRAP-type mannitol/chloroaromatic compound transport system permease large subunit
MIPAALGTTWADLKGMRIRLPVAPLFISLFQHLEASPTPVAGAPSGSWGFLAVTIAAFIILGSVLEGLPAIVLFGPLLFPVAKAMGVHEVHYAMIVTLAMGIGLFAPPFGIGFFSACAIGRTNPDDSVWRIWPYIGALIISLLIRAILSTKFVGPARARAGAAAGAWKGASSATAVVI